MHLSRARISCRSCDPFKPSIALSQHHIRPSLPSPQQRLASSTSPAVESLEPSEPAQSEPRPLVLRKVCYSAIKKFNLSDPSTRTAEHPDLQILDEKGNLLDYEGRNVRCWPPPANPGSIDKEVPWAVPDEESRMLGRVERLEREILNFSEYTKPNRYEAIAREHSVKKLKAYVEEILPKFELEMFGSERTGLAFATSDVDFRLKPKGSDQGGSRMLRPSHSGTQQLLRTLQRLRRNLETRADYTGVNLQYARYPLITLQDVKTGVNMQIVITYDTSRQRHFIKLYQKEYKYIRPLFSVIKTMFDVRGLSNVLYGGFGSYPIFMMIVAALRHRPPIKKNAVGGLRSFFEFWSRFDTTKKGISLEPNELFDKETEVILPENVKSKRNSPPKPPNWLLSLRDPADASNDLGCKGLYIKHVQATCEYLSKKMDYYALQRTASNSLYFIVGPVYETDKVRRLKLRKAGGRIYQQKIKNKPLLPSSEADKVIEKFMSDEKQLPLIQRMTAQRDSNKGTPRTEETAPSPGQFSPGQFSLAELNAAEARELASNANPIPQPGHQPSTATEPDLESNPASPTEGESESETNPPSTNQV